MLFHARVSAEVQAACLLAGHSQETLRESSLAGTELPARAGVARGLPPVAWCWVTPGAPSPPERDTVRDSASPILLHLIC